MRRKNWMNPHIQEALEFHGYFGLKGKDAREKFISQVKDTAALMIDCLRDGKWIFAAGNGGSSCQADHLVEELVARYSMNRRALRAKALTHPGTTTCTADDFDYEYVFSRELENGTPGDIFYGLTTSGNSPNILRAIDTATEIGLDSIVLTGGDTGQLRAYRGKEKVTILAGFDRTVLTGGDTGQLKDYQAREKVNILAVPGDNSARIQEAHITVIHMHCDLIEKALFGEYGD